MKYPYLLCLLCAAAFCSDTKGQLCSNTKDTVYGLSSLGQLVGINVNNGGSVAIGAATGTAVNSNALGYSQNTKLFYFFNKNGVITQRFVSFDPLSGTLVNLAAAPIPANFTIRSGCVNNLGTGYYTVDTANTPSVHSNLLYYNIALNTWSTLTSSFVDASNNPIPAIDSLISGDMAFDGNNNLWMVCSSKWNYALYEIMAPVPVTPVAKITVKTVIPITANPGASFGKVSFTGVAFNSTGTLYMTLGNAAQGNKLYALTTPSAASLTLIGSFTADYGGDLTSCSYPLTVLPTVWLNFQARVQNNVLNLDWEANEDADVAEYSIEHNSAGSSSWDKIGVLEKRTPGFQTDQKYQFTGYTTGTGENFYRIVQVTTAGKETISETRFVSSTGSQKIVIGPNPATTTISLYNRRGGFTYLVQIFDASGKLITSQAIHPQDASIDISRLIPGDYFLRLLSPEMPPAGISFRKN
ncbi:MAG TPA: T9SS type A sorting domain-containing protein [Chitinophagaceae bacterium]|jgi:hypothetical protein